MLAVIDSLVGETRYTYDAAHRLTTATLPDGQSQTFSYDPAGNLLQQPGLNGVKLQGGNRLLSANGDVFDYNHRNHLCHQQRNGHTATQYGYDSRDMLVKCVLEQGEWQAQYDPLGRRVSKTCQGQTTQFYWDTDRLVAEISPEGQLRIYLYVSTLALIPFMFIEYESVAAAPESGQRYFIFGDHLGTPIRVENELAQTVWQVRVSPYGTVQVEVGESFHMPLRFSGHYFDAETGLHYNRFQYYDPSLGRYLQSDPDGIGGGLNVYAYAEDNPLRWVDVRGLGCDDGDETTKNGEDGTDIESTTKKETKTTTQNNNKTTDQTNQSKGKRHKNRIPDKGEPNTTEWNSSGTTAKKYGKDGWVEKEFNKGQSGDKVPEVEKSDHIHDWEPNPYHPEGRPTRQKGRSPTKQDYDDFNIDS